MAQGPPEPGPPSLLELVSPTEEQQKNDEEEGDRRWDRPGWEQGAQEGGCILS